MQRKEGPAGLWGWAGVKAGVLLAPLFGIGSALRRARFFHPEGVVYEAAARQIATEGRFSSVAERLSGPLLVRLSSAWWRHGREWPDVLGIALRFQNKPGAPPSRTDQDLLLATIRTPLALPLSPFLTDVHDFLSNIYYGVSPFKVSGRKKVSIRLRPESPLGQESSSVQGSRNQRLFAAVSQGAALFLLEFSQGSGWIPIVEISLLRQRPDVDQEALRFSPFRSGRGLVPQGFIHGLRRAVYAVSQAVRPSA